MSYQIKAAGGIVIAENKILFIKKNGRWEFPKGRLKKIQKKRIQQSERFVKRQVYKKNI